MKITMNRIISFLLALAMVLAMVPAMGTHKAYAATMEGFFDKVTCPEPGKICVEGWAEDLSTPSNAVQIHVYVGAPVGDPGAVGYPLGYTDVYRQDVINSVPGASGNCGFKFTIDCSKYGNQAVYVYAIADDGSNRQIGEGKSVHISPVGQQAYGDPKWTLSEDDECAEKPDGVYRIASAANPNFSLDISGGSVEYAANLQLWSSADTDAQLFHLRRVSYQDIRTGTDGLLETRTIVSLMNIKSQLFLDKDASSTNVHQYGVTLTSEYRQWIMHNNGDGTYSFESVAMPGYFVTIMDGSLGNGVNIAVTTLNADGKPTLYQKFYLDAEYVNGDNRLAGLTGYFKGGEYRIWETSASSYMAGYALAVTGASKEQGITLQMNAANPATDFGGNMISFDLHQVYDIQKDGEGWYTIRNINSGLYVAMASGAQGMNWDVVHQRNIAGDEAKWAFVPRVRTDGKLCYWIVNKATGLYLFRFGGAGVIAIDNAQDVNSSWVSWGMEACLSAADLGTVTNGSTGIAADQFDTSDTISLPIRIYDYKDDGMLFEYSLSGQGDNGGFTLVTGNNSSQFANWPIGQTTTGNGNFSSEASYMDSFWSSSPDGLNKMYKLTKGAGTGDAIDLEYLGELLNYSFYGQMLSGDCTVGLVKPTLREVDGYKLMEYNDEVVAYIADLLDRALASREQYEKGTPWDNIYQDIPLGTNLPGYDRDMAGLLYDRFKDENGTLLHYSENLNDRRVQIYDSLGWTYAKQDQLIGTWEECKEYITTYTDAAYFLLNNLFYPASYNVPQNKFDYLVLSKAQLTNGKTAYVFDSDFSDSYNYDANTTKSAVKYDFKAKTISNTSMLGKPFERSIYPMTGGAHYTFLPVWDSEGNQTGFGNAYTGKYAGKNYSYVLQCSGNFVYTEGDDLFFNFEGDDDVYLFINGQVVLDIGGAHGATAVNIELNDYVYAAREKVAAGTATDRDKALALVDGEEYSFDFYYMERHTAGANMRIATNIRVSDPNLDTDKKAYQSGVELNNGGLVNAEDHVEYSFKLSNPEDSIADLYHLTFTDAKLGVTMDAVNGLTVSGTKVLNSAGTALTAGDLKIYFTNALGVTSEVSLSGNDPQAALKTYLAEVNGNGLRPGCSIEIRGIYYNIEKSDFVSGRFTNTLHVTANQKADGTGDTYQDSVNMVVCMATGPQYYHWAGHALSVTTDKFTADVNELLTEGSALLEQIAPATALGTVTNLQLCDMKGNVVPNSYVTASAAGIVINYTKPGTYVFYVKVTQSDNSAVIIPVQVYVTDVAEDAYVLDYGLKVDLGNGTTAKDNVSFAGKNTQFVIEGLITEPSYGDNKITFNEKTAFTSEKKEISGKYGVFTYENGTLQYQPTKFMEGPDSICIAVRVYEGTTSSAIGAVNINTEVEMYKTLTILPANVVYYEDDFPAITYYGNGDGKTDNTYSASGNSGDLWQSADQSVQYGYDDAYGTGTTNSGSSAHVIKVLDANVAAEFRFTGTGFELISRCLDTDNCVIYLDVKNSSGALVKRIPVIMEYDDIGVESNEGIYQVPIVRVDGLAHGTYAVQIHGVPVYKKAATSSVGNASAMSTKRMGNLEQDLYAMRLRGITAYTTNAAGGYVVDEENAPTLYIDGLRIYNPLAMDDLSRDEYIDGEDTADFLELRDLVLEGKVAVVEYDANNYSVTTGTSTFTENRNGVLYPVNTFSINSVSNIGYFAAVEDQTLVLRTERSEDTIYQFRFTFAKTVEGVDCYYIHDGAGHYMKNTDDGVVFAASDLTADDGLLWVVTYLDADAGIATIRDQSGAYLSVSSVDAAAKSGMIQMLTTDSITDVQKWELGRAYSTTVFEGNKVTSVNDYLVFGPNNELYLDGVTTDQALVFYFTPDSDPATTTMLQVGVHVLNDNRLFGADGELATVGKLNQSANTGTPGWAVLDDAISSSTERYYPIDLSVCKYDKENNRYEVVLYCEDGYLSFTNLKVSGGTISTVNGEIADLRYNNGVLELLNTQTNTWTEVSDPQNFVNFASVSTQMGASVIYAPDVDTGELVPVQPDDEGENEKAVKLVARSLLFEDIIRIRFYFDIAATGITTTTPDNSGLLVWTEEKYAALDSFTVETAGQHIRGLSDSANGYYADTHGIPAKKMVDQLYACAYVILPDGSYVYSDVTQYSPVMYAQRILAKESSSQPMKELVVALMNYGTAAQLFFDYKTDSLMNDWLTEEQRSYVWSEDMMNVLPTDTSKYAYTANDQIVWKAASVSFTGAVNQNYYFNIPEELLQGARKVELLYWTESDYNTLSQLTVDNARKVAFNVEKCAAVIEGTPAKDLGDASYFAVHIVYEDGETFGGLCVYSAHHYARRLLSKDATSDAMKELAKALVYYSCMAKNMFGG